MSLSFEFKFECLSTVECLPFAGHITQQLVIQNVQPEDAGKYMVVVENTAGKDACEAILNVVGEFVSLLLYNY